MNTINIVAIFETKAECKDQLLEVLYKVIDESRKEEGCMQYDLQQDSKNPAKLILLEVWRSQQDIDIHSQTSHFKTLIKELDGKVDSFSVDTMNKIY